MMHNVQESRAGPKEKGRKAAILVLAPTRELARQVAETFELLAQPDGLRVSVFHGGTPYGPQQRALREGLDVIVGTPGRIIDHLTNGDLDLSGIEHAQPARHTSAARLAPARRGHPPLEKPARLLRAAL